MLEAISSFFQAIVLTGFCAMVIDGQIDSMEVNLNQAMFKEYTQGDNTAYIATTNYYIEMANADYHGLIGGYLNALENQPLTEDERLMIKSVVDSIINVDGILTDIELRFLELTDKQLNLNRENPDKNDARKNNDTDTENNELILKFLRSIDFPEFEPIK